MCACVCAYMHVHLPACVHVCMHMFVIADLCVFECLHMFVCVLLYVCIQVCAVCVRVLLFICDYSMSLFMDRKYRSKGRSRGMQEKDCSGHTLTE